MVSIAESQAARRHLPRRTQRLGEFRIALRNFFRKRREFLIDAREARLVLVEVAPLLQVASQQADLFNQLRQENRDVVFHLEVPSSKIPPASFYFDQRDARLNELALAAGE